LTLLLEELLDPSGLHNIGLQRTARCAAAEASHVVRRGVHGLRRADAVLVRRIGSAVDVAPVSDLDHGHRFNGIGDLVENPVVASADAIELDPRQLLGARRTRVPRECPNAPDDSSSILARYGFEPSLTAEGLICSL